MKRLYECEYCKKQFNDEAECRIHEMNHLTNKNDMFKYWVCSVAKDDICKYCNNVYYAYGCEQSCAAGDCSAANNYQHFELDQRLFERKD